MPPLSVRRGWFDWLIAAEGCCRGHEERSWRLVMESYKEPWISSVADSTIRRTHAGDRDDPVLRRLTQGQLNKLWILTNTLFFWKLKDLHRSPSKRHFWQRVYSQKEGPAAVVWRKRSYDHPDKTMMILFYHALFELIEKLFESNC